MIIVPKDTTPHRTVDLQPLNTQYLCETHHSPSPFQLVSHIPTNTFKTVLDAVGGYHAIPVDKDSQYLTAFITEWGRPMYKQIPQGFIAAGNIYTRQYDKSSKVYHKKRNVLMTHDFMKIPSSKHSTTLGIISISALGF